MNLQTDDFQALTDLEVRAHEARNQAERLQEQRRQAEAVEKALSGILVARNFLRRQRLGPGTPVFAPRPAGERPRALGGIEHAGVTFTSTIGGPGFLIAPDQICAIHELAYLEDGLSRGQSSKALGWKPIDEKNTLFGQLIRLYPLISFLNRKELSIYGFAFLILGLLLMVIAVKINYSRDLHSLPIFNILQNDKDSLLLVLLITYFIGSIALFMILNYSIKLSEKIFFRKSLLLYREVWGDDK